MRSDMRNLYYDVVIAGCGVAGLYAALNLPEEMSVLMLSKEDLESCDSMLAQGGICVLRDEEDYDSYFEDTMRAGHYENRKESVDIMIRSSRDVINDLLNFGVRFAKNPDGSLGSTLKTKNLFSRGYYRKRNYDDTFIACKKMF